MDREMRRKNGAKAAEKRDCGVDGCNATVPKCRYADHILDEHGQ